MLARFFLFQNKRFYYEKYFKNNNQIRNKYLKCSRGNNMKLTQRHSIAISLKEVRNVQAF